MDPVRLDCLFCFSCLLFLLTLYAILVFLVIQFFDGQEWSVPLVCSHVFILTLVLLTIILRLWKRWDGRQKDGDGVKGQWRPKGNRIPPDIRLLGIGMSSKSSPAIIRKSEEKDDQRPFVPTESMVIRANQPMDGVAEQPELGREDMQDGLVLSVA